MMKIGWGLISNKDALWARVIRSKYKCGDDLLPKVDLKRQGSRVWSGIKSTWQNVKDSVEIMHRNGNECACWKHNRSGEFSVKSAYKSLTNDHLQSSTDWSKLWKLQVPQRCKTHMWVLMHDRILSNVLLWKRGLHANGTCKFCRGIMETTIHVSRDCSYAKDIWLALGIPYFDNKFWNSDLTDWISYNIRENKRLEHGKWNDLFSVTCWLLWRRRNERTHLDRTTSVEEGVAEIQGVVRCMVRDKIDGKNPMTATKKVLRTMPNGNADWVRVYVDGAFSHVSQTVACGGVMRRADESIVEGFMCRIQGSHCLTAEIWG